MGLFIDHNKKCASRSLKTGSKPIRRDRHARYKTHPDIDTLYCFVYDPDGWIDNPVGIENDLSGLKENMSVLVRIEPR